LSWSSTFKGIVQPKMKILSSFTRPPVAQNLYEFLSTVEHNRFPPTMEVNGFCNCLVTSILQNIFFCFSYIIWTLL